MLIVEWNINFRALETQWNILCKKSTWEYLKVLTPIGSVELVKKLPQKFEILYYRENVSKF